MKIVRSVLYILVASLAFLIQANAARADSFTSSSSCTQCFPSFSVFALGNADGAPGEAQGSVAFGLDTFNFDLTGGVASFGGSIPIPQVTINFPNGGGSWTLLDQSNAILAQGVFGPGAVGDSSFTLSDFSAALGNGGTLALGCELSPLGEGYDCKYSLDGVRLATPEPGTMLLLGVGVLGLASAKLLKK